MTTFEKIPTAALTEVKLPDETKPQSPAPAASSEAAMKNTTTIDELLKGSSNTELPKTSIQAPQPTSSTPQQQQQQPNTQPTANNVAVGSMLEGKLAIELIDAMLPSLFVAMFYAMGVKLRKTEFQLTQKEKDTLSPLMQNCLNSVMLNFNSPWTALAVTAGIIYGSKITEKGLVSWIDKMNEKKEIEALQEKTKVVPISQVKQQQPQQQQQQNSVVNNVLTLSEQPKPYTESEVRRVMKEKNYGRTRAENWLNKKYKLVP